MSTSFKLNGSLTTLDVDPTMPVLWAVREAAGLHGTKFGCGMALCGACTIHLDGQAVRSCVLPLSAVAGREVTTIEGLQGRASESGASGLDLAAGAAMRLLPVRSGHGSDGTARKKSCAERLRYRRRDEWQHLPLCNLCANPCRHPLGGGIAPGV